MFEIAELGHRVTDEDFESAEAALRMRLLAVQRTLRTCDRQVIVVVSGVEGAGKTGVVNRLHEWLDARGLQTHSFWTETDEERTRPHYWRYWRRLPARGSIGVMFGSWYTQPIIDRVYGGLNNDEFEAEVHRIRQFERLLADDGAVIIKLWFHIDKKLQKKRIKQAQKAERNKKSKKQRRAGAAAQVRVSPLAAEFAEQYDAFTRVSERAIRATDAAHSRWNVVESSDANYRDLSAGNIVATVLERTIGAAAAPKNPVITALEPSREEALTVLSRVDLGQKLSKKEYESRLAKAQGRLYDLAWLAHKEKRSTVLVFEGWDAAGKGGAIRRLTSAMDARLYRVVPIAAPTDEERAQHYLWRFWRHLPSDGNVRIYDRSWYGRVLVERVEGFAEETEWSRAYEEINAFERQLDRHGTIICKFWLHISAEEQLARFKARQQIPWKQHKITDEDWRNREKWSDYRSAVNDMVARTSSSHAPWTLVAANSKKFARVQVVETVCDALEAALG